MNLREIYSCLIKFLEKNDYLQSDKILVYLGTFFS
jgi:hypothetical protein